MARRLKKCFKHFLKRTGIRKGLIGGVLILLLVDLIWVASAALSRFLFIEESYPKPFFTTYFKTSLFSIYLSAFIFWRPWQRLCVRGCAQKKKCDNVRVCTCGEGKVCVCGGSKEEEKNQLLNSDSDISDTSVDEHAPFAISPSTSLTYEGSDGSHTPENKPPPLDSALQSSIDNEPALKVHVDFHEDCQGSHESAVDHAHPPPGGDDDSEHTTQLTPVSEKLTNTPSLTATTPLASTPPSLEVSSHSPPSPTIQSPDSPQLPSDQTTPSVPDSSPSQSAACPFAEYVQDSRIVPMEGVREGGAKFVTFRGSARYGSINGNPRVMSCPINPELKICLLGPPEYEPLGCYEEDSSEDEHKPNEPLSPCHNKCCKVRFKPTVEVREVKGEVATGRRKLFHSLKRKEKWRSHELLSVWKVALLAAIFGVVWFFANYLYATALNLTSVAAVNTLSSTSGVFVMALAALPCLSVTAGDKLTLSRCLVTLISVGGAVLVSLSPSGDDEQGSKFSPGALFALGGSVLYAIYLVLLRRVVTDHDSLDIPMFFGFVGLFDGVFLLPLLVIWHVTSIEQFEFPPTADVWTILLVNGFIGTVLSELLWLWGVFLTSPLLGTLALSLVTPLSLAYSIVIGKTTFSWMFLVGAVLILLSFIAVTILDHYGAWDPLWAGMKTLFLKARDYRYHREFRTLSPESQHLITSSSGSGSVGHCQDYLAPT